MQDLQDQKESLGHRAELAFRGLLDALLLDRRVIQAQVVHLALLGRLATDFLVQRVTVETVVQGVHLVLKEMAILALWVLLVYLDFRESLARKALVSQDQRGILASVGRLVYPDLQAKASKDLQEIKADLGLLGQQDRQVKESKDQRASRGLKA